jgi:hypothetical protein
LRKRSVFYSLGPGLGKRRSSFLAAERRAFASLARNTGVLQWIISRDRRHDERPQLAPVNRACNAERAK